MNNSDNTNPDNTNRSLSMKGKTALVTGAAGGLGQNFTQCLLEAGATVIVSGRRREALGVGFADAQPVQRPQERERGTEWVAHRRLQGSSAAKRALERLYLKKGKGGAGPSS